MHKPMIPLSMLAAKEALLCKSKDRSGNMSENFDIVIDRRNTWSTKWGHNEKNPEQEDLLAMWIADMDFLSPAAVAKAITKQVEHGVFGYFDIPDSCLEATINWSNNRYNWEIKKEWLVYSPSVSTSIKTAIEVFTNPGDKILIQPPVYAYFRYNIENSNRQVVVNPLQLHNGSYTIDFEDLERKLSAGVKMFIFCSPHNPVGRVWTVDELDKIANLCSTYNVTLVSDEAHSDLIFDNYKHTPIASLSSETAHNTITFISPAKTFNLSGLATSFAIIPRSDYKKEFFTRLVRTGANKANIFGIAAVEAAFSHGEEWLENLLEYLQENLEILMKYISENIPIIKVIKAEGTYLIWLDCRELGLQADELNQFIINTAKVVLDDGSHCGTEGTGFLRINIACPKSVLLEALRRIENAVNELTKSRAVYNDYV